MARTEAGIHPKASEFSLPINACAALSSYLVLVGAFFVLTILGVTATFTRPGTNAYQLGLVTLAAGLLIATWLRGFRVRITEAELYIRNGLYRSVIVPLDEVRQAEHRWVEEKFGFRRFTMLRFVVVYDNRAHPKRVTLNTKPFRLDDLGRIRDTLQNAIARNQHRSP